MKWSYGMAGWIGNEVIPPVRGIVYDFSRFNFRCGIRNIF